MFNFIFDMFPLMPWNYQITQLIKIWAMIFGVKIAQKTNNGFDLILLNVVRPLKTNNGNIGNNSKQ